MNFAMDTEGKLPIDGLSHPRKLRRTVDTSGVVKSFRRSLILLLAVLVT